MYPVQQPEFYLGKVDDKFNEQGDLTDEPTKKLIARLWEEYVIWIGRVSG
jgi:chromate reductase, NAD(P)H dehydrogenase (quinone)